MKKYRIIRIILASLMFVACLGIFLDFTGVLPTYLGWAARIQFIPAVLALNVAALVVLIVLALLFGRLYCSIICPLGIFQDLWSGLRGKKRKYKAWKQTKALRAVRYGFLGVFVVLVIAGLTGIAAFIEPYSAFGRMASSLLAPLYDMGNNVLASSAEQSGSFDYYNIEVWIRGMSSLIFAIITFVGLAVASVITGRGYCNTVCPVGTILGLVSRFAVFKIRIDESKCKNCGACSNKCKGHCIDIPAKQVDVERCVVCMNCLTACRHDAIKYMPSLKSMISRKSAHDDVAQVAPGASSEVSLTPKDDAETPNAVAQTPQTETIQQDAEHCSRRMFMSTAAVATASALVCPFVAKAGEDGTLAKVSAKDPSPRETQITPPGSGGHLNFYRRCTGCMLCVRACHNQVLRTQNGPDGILRPALSFEKSFCRPTCNDCSQVCPTGAIRPISLELKSSTQIGMATWNKDACLSATKGVHCRGCARACPSGAISFVESQTPEGKKCKIPVVDSARCIGCGACEYVCPARPIAAIHVEGIIQHHEI